MQSILSKQNKIMSLNDPKNSFASSNPINIDLQLNLLNTWTRFKVAEYYQNIVLAHLDEHQPSEAEEHIRKEIKLTLQKKSPYFQLERRDQERKNILMMLQNKLEGQQEIVSTEELSHLCQLLKQLREITLLTAEQILKMYNIYHCSQPQNIEKQMEYYDIMLENLDRDNIFLKESVLNDYIIFDHGYDPFLMAQYQRIHRNNTNKIGQPIVDLYSMNISQAYRLIKTKNTILQLRSLAKRKEQEDDREQSINTSYKFYSQQPGLSQKYKKKNSQNNGQIVPTERMTLRQSNALLIKPIQVYPSHKMKSRTTFYNDKEERPISSSNTDIREPSKLKFMKINPPYQSRSSSFHIRSLAKSKQRKLSNLDLPSQSAEKIEKNKNFYQARKPFSQEPEEDNKKPASGRYRAGVGEIYRSVRLTPLKNRKYLTEPKEQQDNIQPNVKVSSFSYEELKENNKKIYFNESIDPPIKKPQKDELSSPIVKKEKQEKQQQSDSESEGKNQREIDPNPKLKKIKYYNPIKKEEYQMNQTIIKNKKYDFNPQMASQKIKGTKKKNSHNLQIIEEDDTQGGLLYERPISKYNIKPKKITKKDPQKSIMKNKNKMVDQQAQTMNQKQEKKSSEKNNKNKNPPPPPSSPTQSAEQESDQQAQPRGVSDKKVEQAQPPARQVNKAPDLSKQTNKPPIKSPQDNSEEENQTISEEDIIDDRPQQKSSSAKPSIRSANKQSSGPSKSGNVNQSQVIGSTSQKTLSNLGDKKEIRMKVGKLNLPEVVSLLQKIKINEKFKDSFQLEKITLWIKTNQTYLIEFHLNDELAILALCSPLPNIGMTLKLWAPIRKDLDDNVCLPLFKKYIEFIQKVTTVQKIMFSGKPFPGLTQSDFTKKKQNLYERIRKIPAKESDNQFKPFIYIECSNVKFSHQSKQKILYSSEISEFSKQNYYAIPFFGNVNNEAVSTALKPLVKFNSKLPNFKAVNQILTKQDFDNYEAQDLDIVNIDLIRFYLNSTLKSSFIGQDGFFKFIGSLVYEKGPECIVSVNASKHNGILYLCKNLQWQSIMKLIKNESSKKVQFSVMMFNKKIYGNLSNSPAGCYGNWQINLIWEDQMQGKIKHSMKEGKVFGPESFKVLIQLEKEAVFGFSVDQQDSIL